MLFRTRSFGWKSTFQWSVALIGFFLLFGHSIATAAESGEFTVVDKREVQGYQRTKEICQRLLNAVPQKYRSAKKWQLHLISVTGDRNAFATGDGYIAIDYRFLKETDDAIAWVLGHEISHSLLGHGASLENYKGSLTPVEKTVQKFIPSRYQFAKKLERDNEETADSFAFTLVEKAGYNLNKVKEFMQKEANEEGSLMRLAKWMEGSHPTSQERAKVAEERVKAEEKVAQSPQQQREPTQRGKELIQNTAEVRTLPNGCSFVLMWTDPETGTKFWSYTFNSSDPCYSWAGWNPQMPLYPGQLCKTIIGEVPRGISLADDKVAHSIVMKIMNFIIGKCPVDRGAMEPVEIKLVPEGFAVMAKKGPTAYFEVSPLLVKATFVRLEDPKTSQKRYQPSGYKNMALAKEQAELEAKQAASISKLGPQKAAEELLAQKITKCGNSHYTKDLDPGGYPLGLYEFKNLSIQITASPLTEADKLNGIEWKGTVILVAKATRAFKVPGMLEGGKVGATKQEWLDWESGAKIDHQSVYGSLLKKKGRWHLQLQIGVMGLNLKPIKCSEIQSGG